MSQSPVLIAIAGGSASGKSRFAEAVARALSDGGCTVIAEDDYYVDAGNLPGFDPHRFNFDEPAAKDHNLLVQHLQALKSGKAVDCPIYDFTTHCRAAETVRRSPDPVVIVEGLHVLASETLRACFDLTVFVYACDATRLARRVDRDVAERGRTAEFARHQFETHVRPMHDLHIEPQRAFADLVIDNMGAPDFDILVRPVIAAIQARQS